LGIKSFGFSKMVLLVQDASEIIAKKNIKFFILSIK
jgi:hypothetical protein